MTIHAFNRRIQITSTYHVKRRANRRVVVTLPRAARDTVVLWATFGAMATVLVALAQLGGSL